MKICVLVLSVPYWSKRKSISATLMNNIEIDLFCNLLNKCYYSFFSHWCSINQRHAVVNCDEIFRASLERR